jgi:2'-5' RNA ligase
MKNQIRAFIAVPLPPMVRSAIAKLIRFLQTTVEETKWTEPENLHITLKFLGDVSLNDLPEIIKAMKQTAAKVEPFDIEIAGCGAFPNWETPKTIWVGCEQNDDKDLSQLAETLETDFFNIGFAKEPRRFSPHLTLGRIKNHHSVDAIEIPHRSYGYCGVDEIILYSSELTKRGPIYDELAVVPLGLR